MKYSFEEQALQNKPMPDGLTTYEKQIYIVLRNLYYAMNKGTITQQQAQKEKNTILKELDDLNTTREFERKCWENSSKRTMAADRALMMYHQSRTLENADILYDRLEWLHDECAIPAVQSEYGANCPICGRFFNQDHASNKPTYCQDCGCRLGWD